MTVDIAFLEPRGFLATGVLSPQDWEPSLGLMCLAAFLEEHHPELSYDVLDPVLLGGPEDPEAALRTLSQELVRAQPRWVGIPFNLSRTYADSAALARLARRCCPEARIVVGGNHATCVSEDLLREVPEIDVVIRRDAEHSLAELLGGVPLPEIGGLVYRDGGELRTTPARKLPEDLDVYPNPYRVGDRFQIERRLFAVQGCFEDTIFGRMVLTSRGCPYECEFCTNACVTDRRMRYHGIEYVQRAVRLVRDRYLRLLPFPILNLTDAIFTANRARTLALAAALEGSGVQYHCQTRVECCDPEILDALQRMGMSCVSFGIESLTPAIRARTGKRFDAQILKALVGELHARSIRAAATFIVGLPGETEDTILENARAAAWCGFDEAFFFPLVGVRGSTIFDRLVREVPPERRETVGRPENREWLYTAEFPGAELRRLASACEEIYRRG